MMKPSHVVALGLFLVSCGRPASGLSPGPATPAWAKRGSPAGGEPPAVQEVKIDDEEAAVRPRRSPRLRPPDVTDAAFSPDGRFALAAVGGNVSLYDLKSGRVVRTFAPGEGVTAVTFAPDGKRFLAGSPALPGQRSGTITLWDVATGKRLREFTPFRGVVYRLAFSPDGKYALSSGTTRGGVVELWDVSTGKVVRSFVGHTDAVYAVAFSPDGRWVLSGSEDQTARVWSVATGREVRQLVGHTGRVRAVAFSPTGRFALTGDEKLRLWEVASGKQVGAWGAVQLGVFAVHFLPGGDQALTAGEGFQHEIKVWDLARGKVVRSFNWGYGGIQGVAVSGDGARALLYQQGGLVLWDLRSGEEVCALYYGRGAAAAAKQVAFSPDGKRALALWGGVSDTEPALWDLAADRVIGRLKGHRGEVRAVAFSPDGKLCATGSLDGSVRLWDAATGRAVRALDDPGEDRPRFGHVFGVAFSPDGRRILGYGHGREGPPEEADRDGLRVWDVRSGKRVGPSEGYKGSMFFAAFLPDGKRVLAQDIDKVIGLFDVEGGKIMRAFRAEDASGLALALTPDGKQVLLSDWGKVWLWDLATGKGGRALAEDTGGIRRVALSPDGEKVLWQRRGDRWLNVTDVKTGELVGAIPPRRVCEWAWVVAFAPDGRLVRFEGTGRRLKLTLHKLDEVATVPGGASPRPLGEQKGR
jgi:WD40 repeat protein